MHAEILGSTGYIQGNANISVWILKNLAKHFRLHSIGSWDKLLSWLKMLDKWIWHHRSRFVNHLLIQPVFFEGALRSQALLLGSEQNRHGV